MEIETVDQKDVEVYVEEFADIHPVRKSRQSKQVSTLQNGPPQLFQLPRLMACWLICGRKQYINMSNSLGSCGCSVSVNNGRLLRMSPSGEDHKDLRPMKMFMYFFHENHEK